jgi:hypothetical protein
VSVGLAAHRLPTSQPIDTRIEGSCRAVLYGYPEALVIFSTALAAK